MSPQFRTYIFVLVAASVSSPALGQNSGTAQGSTQTNGSTTSTNTTTTTTTNTPTPVNPPSVPRPIPLSGRVMVDDGTPPPSLVVVESGCNGTFHAIGETDGKGYFSILLGQDTGRVGDASESNGMSHPIPGASLGGSGGAGKGSGISQMNRTGTCELRARIGGYRSQTISLRDHGPMDNPNVGTILIHAMNGSESGTTAVATTLRAPKPAAKAQQKGLDLLKKNQPEEAMDAFRQAVKLYPEFAAAWLELGKLQYSHQQRDDARQSFEAAVKAEPRWPEPRMQLAVLAVEAGQWAEVATITDSVLNLDSFTYPQAYFFNAAANYNLKRLEAAQKSGLAARRLDAQHQYPQNEHLLGNIYIQFHQFPEAAEALRTYLQVSPSAPDAAAARKQLGDVERVLQAAADSARK